MLSGLLGGVPDVVSARGVELGVGGREEPDRKRSPHRQDDGFAPGGQLLAGLDNRLAG